MRVRATTQVVSAAEWERICNVLRVEEPASLHQIKHWLLDEFNINQLYRMLEEMRQAGAVTMELRGEIGNLQVLYWYGIHE